MHKHHGLPAGDSLGQHAMVLMGVRSDPETGEERFILQNWSVGCRVSASSAVVLLHSCARAFMPIRQVAAQAVCRGVAVVPRGL